MTALLPLGNFKARTLKTGTFASVSARGCGAPQVGEAK